jgi:AcrR family transcriptional regulator
MTRQRTDEQRKQQIRSAAVRCFVRRGYESTRLLDIAREAGLSKGGVYFHYRTKDELFHDILEAHVVALQGRWSFEPAADQPADRTLRRLLIAHLRTLEDEPEQTRLCNLLITMAAQDAAFRTRLDGVFQTLTSLYRAVITRGMREGAFAPGDPEATTHVVLAAVVGMGGCSALDPSGKLSVPIEDVADIVLRMARPLRPAIAEVPAPSATATASN